MTDTPPLLLAHHLKTLKLPTFLREYDKVARQCAAEGVDYASDLIVCYVAIVAMLWRKVGLHPTRATRRCCTVTIMSRERGGAITSGPLVLPAYSGMLSCFFSGISSVLVRSMESARAIRRRVKCGMITSSI
jgi:hypothetical protein